MYKKLHIFYSLCIVCLCHSLPAAQDLLSMMPNPSPHSNPAERGWLGSLNRYWDKSNSVVRWAMLGIDLELTNTPHLRSYMQDHVECMDAIKQLYEANYMLITQDPLAGNQQCKLNDRFAFIVSCREEALEAFNRFEHDAKRDTAKKAALFLRASQLLSQKNVDFIAPIIQQALKKGRKAIRSRLRSYLVTFANQELIDLASRQYDYRCLYDSEDEADGQTEQAKRLETLMTIEVHDDPQEDEYGQGPEGFNGREIAHL